MDGTERDTETDTLMKRIARWTLSTVTALFTAVAFIGAGLAVCAVPDMTTRTISEATSASDVGFSQEQLTHMAVITKQYTVNVHDRSQLDGALRDINSGRDISKLDERYVLGQDAIDHLDDVHAVLVRAGLVLAGSALAALLLGVLCGLWKGAFLVGDMLVEAGAITLVVMASCAITAIVDFNVLFGALHTALFDEGTWTFAADSLLISMYPQAFWTTMGIVWAVVTALLAIAAIVIGIALRVHAKRRAQVPYPFAQAGYDILYY